jgi:hypothetical protein
MSSGLQLNFIKNWLVDLIEYALAAIVFNPFPEMMFS